MPTANIKRLNSEPTTKKAFGNATAWAQNLSENVIRSFVVCNPTSNGRIATAA